MDILLVVLNAAVLVVLLVILGLVLSIKKSMSAKDVGPNDETGKPPLPTSQDGGEGQPPNDPPAPPPIPT